MTDFQYKDPFALARDATPFRRVTSDHVSVGRFEGQEMLKVAPEALRIVAREAFRDVSFLYRPGHLAQLAAVLEDPEASGKSSSATRPASSPSDSGRPAPSRGFGSTSPGR